MNQEFVLRLKMYAFITLNIKSESEKIEDATRASVRVSILISHFGPKRKTIISQ